MQVPSDDRSQQAVLAPGRWDPAIHQALEQMIVDHGQTSAKHDPSAPPVATFDWDNTAIRGDIGEAILEVLDARDNGGRVAEYERLCETAGKPVGYPWAAYQIAGLTERGVRDLTLEVIDRYLADGRIRLRPEMRDLIAVLQAHGWDVWVVSASAEPLVRAFAQLYGIPSNRVIGMRLGTDSRGVYQPELVGPNTFRAGKVEAIDAFIGRRPVFATGDTETDIEMLDSARHRLLMDRGCGITRAAADRGRWWIQTPGW